MIQKHVPALDGIRGIAVLLVLAHNFNVIGGPLAPPGPEISLLMDIGWLGVQLFFVLSGFLITGILLDTRKASNYWRSFLGRRVLRIFPLYYAVLIAAFVIAPLVLGHGIAGSEHQLWLWTYLGNWAEPVGRGVPLFPHFWSLAIEEQFYLAWPFLVRAISPRALGRLCIGIAAAAMASRIALLADGDGSGAAYMFTICRIDALALGALAAVLARDCDLVEWMQRHRRTIRIGALLAIAATIVLTRGAPRAGVLTQTFGYTVFAAAFAAIVLDVGTADPRGRVVRALAWSPLRSAGKYSYGMYVFHTPFHLLVGLPILVKLAPIDDIGLPLALAYYAIATLCTFVLAVISYHLLEKHFLRLKKYFEAH